MTEQHRCWIEVDQNALRHNAAVLRERAGARVQVLAVVKANAYGHGAAGVARALADDVELFGVANLEEAISLASEVANELMILGPALPHETREITKRGFIPSISTMEEAENFNQHAVGQKLKVNFKIDTGMGRMGAPEEKAVDLFRRVNNLPNLVIHSVSTHLPVCEEDEIFARQQLRQFSDLMRKLQLIAPGPYKVHALHTMGLFAFGDEPFEIIRPGIGLYGISPSPEFQSALRPAMTWKTRIALIRDIPSGHGISYGRTFITRKPTRVATVAAGYADGYSRHLSNSDASMLVHGHRCPLLGRVTMDLTMIDLSDVADAAVGDEVVLMGRQGNEEIPCAELAERAGTIAWEITTRIGTRVHRVYV